MKALVAIIAYNEEKNIAQTIADLKSFQPRSPYPFDIVVIDNGSTDQTAQVAKAQDVPVVSHCINTGGSGGTVMSYFRYAYTHGYDLLCQFDGDGQHLASELPKIMMPVVEGRANYVIGSRYLEKVGFQSSFIRRLGIRFLGALATWIVRQKVTDITSGARAYGKPVIDLFSRYYRHEIHDPGQLLVMSHFFGIRFTEVPVVMKERIHGVSEFNFRRSMSFVVKGVMNMLGCVLQRKQTDRYRRAYFRQ